jgi:membrane protease YdiL (CAAX protease family)
LTRRLLSSRIAEILPLLAKETPMDTPIPSMPTPDLPEDATSTDETSSSSGTTPPVKPMKLPLALLFFGIPSVVFCISLLGVLPWLLAQGYSRFAVFNITFGIPLALMLLASVIAYRMEGRPWQWAAFRDRMRLRAMGKRDWVWTLGLVVFIILVGLLPAGWTGWLAPVVFYHQPAAFSDFMANFATETTFMGLPVTWGLFLYFMACLLILNIAGEEFWWRGYILPRQEAAHGAWAWLPNGVLWAMFHAFYHWNLASLVAMLPVTLSIAFVAQRTKNTWPACIGHTVGNIGVPLLMLKALL